jgi:hypothetical protein
MSCIAVEDVTGHPLSGVSCSAVDPVGIPHTGITDSNGEYCFTFSELPGVNRIEVTISKPGYETRGFVYLAMFNGHTIHAHLSPEVVPETYSTYIVVSPRGHPETVIPSAIMYLMHGIHGEFWKYADSNGIVSLENMPAAHGYDGWVEAPGYEVKSLSGIFLPMGSTYGSPYLIYLDGGPEEPEPEPENVTVIFRIQDGSTWIDCELANMNCPPISGCRVDINAPGGPYVGISDAAGEARIQLPIGSMSYRINPPVGSSYSLLDWTDDVVTGENQVIFRWMRGSSSPDVPDVPDRALHIISISPETIPNGIYHEGNPIEIFTTILNDTDVTKEVRVKMRSAGGKILDTEPDLHWKNIPAGGIDTISVAYAWVIPAGFENEYITIELWEQHTGKVDTKHVTVGNPDYEPDKPPDTGYGSLIIPIALIGAGAYVLGEMLRK